LSKKKYDVELLKELPIFCNTSGSYYPVIRRMKDSVGQELYYFDENGNAELMCQFPTEYWIDDLGSRMVYAYHRLLVDATDLNKDENVFLITDEEGKVISKWKPGEYVKGAFPAWVAKDYVVLGNTLYRLPELEPVMQLFEDPYWEGCNWGRQISENRFIFSIHNGIDRTLEFLLVDIEKRQILKSVENPYLPGSLTFRLGSDQFVYGAEDKTNQEYRLLFYNSKLELINKIAIDLSDFIAEVEGLVFVWYNEYKSELYLYWQEGVPFIKVELANSRVSFHDEFLLRDSWEYVNCSKDFLVFVSANEKNLKIVDIELETVDNIRFEHPINCVVASEEELFVVTMLEADDDYGTGHPVAEGKLSFFKVSGLKRGKETTAAVRKKSGGDKKKTSPKVLPKSSFYGEGTFMACLWVYAPEGIGKRELKKKVNETKKLFPGRADSFSLVLEAPEFPWIGISCDSLQQQASLDMVTKCGLIWERPVLMYNIFDEDAIMLGYAENEGKDVYFSCDNEEFAMSEQEQVFPKGLLKFFPGAEEKVQELWENDEYVFASEKLLEIFKLMPDGKLPEYYVGIHSVEELEDGAGIYV